MALTTGMTSEASPTPPAPFTFKMLADLPFKADASTSEDLYLMGTKLLYGAGVSVDIEQAVKLLFQSSDFGHPGAQSVLGSLYTWGIGVPRDPALATLFHRFASRGGQHVSTVALAASYSRNPSTMCDAAGMYVTAANEVQRMRSRTPQLLPHVEAVRIAGLGPGSYPNENTNIRTAQRGENDNVITFFQHLADRAGNVDALRQLGTLYFLGARGMPRDMNRANELLGRAAERGDVSALAFVSPFVCVRIPILTAAAPLPPSPSTGPSDGPPR